MKKTIYTLNINDYNNKITNLTYPLIERYANKIQANIYTINTRQWPDYTPVYEKLQIYELQKLNNDDWSIYIDSDTLVHPDMFDITEFVSKDTVVHNGNDFANNRWRYDNYFRRDGRNIGSCNWLTVASDWCRDLWHPLDDMTYEEALENIFPIQEELNTVITKEHLIDDYILSRNIAKYGLHFDTIVNIQDKYKIPGGYFWHQYTITTDEKIREMKKVLNNWGINYAT